MLSKLKGIKHFSRSVLFPKTGLGLRSILTTAGYTKETSIAYSWDGLKRGKNQLIVFQYTLTGRGELKFAGEIKSLEAGDAFLVTVPHDNHYYLPPDSESWEFIFMCISGREAVRLANELIAENGPVFKLNVESLPVKGLIETVRKVYHQEVASQYQASLLSYKILMTLAHHFRMEFSEIALPDNIKRAVAFCEENFKEDIGVAELAEISGYSRYHFSRIFKKTLGVAPGEYLQTQRLRYAAALLNDPKLNIKEIAYQSGFNDYNYFCRAFRKSYGQSAGSFRKSGLA